MHSLPVLPAKGFAMTTRTARKHLSADSLFRVIRTHFDRIADPRGRNADIPLGDALMSAFAMFALKDPSLLAFDERRNDPNDNFRSIYLLDRVTSSNFNARQN
jgi:hypothetical protein